MSHGSGQDLKKVGVGLVGAGGRMGQNIAAVIKESARFTLRAEIDAGRAWPAPAAGIDVVIDFSRPEGLAAALDWCLSNNVPLVSGTTGLDDGLTRRLRAAGQKIPVLYSANMSPGIAIMSAMLNLLAGVADWDFHVDEIHHAQKKDAPSGTAMLLDDRLARAIGRRAPVPNSIRGGNVPGLHQVWAMGEDEVLLLQHTALDRRVFARGAVKAAGWLFDKGTPGFYDLRDLYNK